MQKYENATVSTRMPTISNQWTSGTSGLYKKTHSGTGRGRVSASAHSHRPVVEPVVDQWSLQWRKPTVKKTKARYIPPGRQDYPTSGPVEPVVRALNRNTKQREGVGVHRRPAEYQWSNPWSSQWLRQSCARQTQGNLFQQMIERYSLSGTRCWYGWRITRGSEEPQSREERAALCAGGTEALPRDLECKP